MDEKTMVNDILASVKSDLTAYQTAITETESLLERVYKGSVSMMMSTLIRNNNLSEADMEELYQILGEALENDD